MWRLSSFCRQTTSGVPPGIPLGCHDGRFIRRFPTALASSGVIMTRRQILQYDRADFDVVTELEQKTGFIVRPDSLLIQMISAPHSDETERPISWRYFRRRLRPVAEPHRSRAQGCDTSPPATSCKFDGYWRVRGDRQSAGCYSAMCQLSFDDESGRQATRAAEMGIHEGI